MGRGEFTISTRANQGETKMAAELKKEEQILGSGMLTAK